MKTQFNRSNFFRTCWTLTIMLISYLFACAQSNVHKQEEKDRCESPYFIILSEEGENEQLPLKSTMVDVNIAGVIANVKVKQVYSNTGKNSIEAIYVFPASTRAAVYEMIMKVDDREIIAIVEEKQQARNMYEEAKNEGKTASLLEEHRPNVFQMNVANIMPGARVEVTLSYTELLIPTEKVYEFAFPTVVGPRYVSEGEIKSATIENWTSNPYTEEGVKPKSTLDINVNINAGMPLKEIRCETHKNEISYKGKSKAQIVLKEKDGGNRDFVVQYRLAGNQIESGVLLYEDSSGEKYFLATMQAPKRVENQEITPREYIFIVDVSGSMSGFPLEVSKEIMKNLLDNIKSTDKFNIVQFAGGSKVYADKSLPATEQNVKNAISYMSNLRGGGGTELLSALKTAMQLNANENYSRSFVILTDGYVSVEKQAFDYIRSNLGKANFFTFGIGSSVNRYLIEGLAHVGYGEPFIALNKSEGSKQAKKFTRYVSAPVLTNIELSFSGIETYDVLPEKIPDLFAERPLIISGKYKGAGNGKITLKGKGGSSSFNETLILTKETSSKNSKALKYFWAREKIRLISDYNKILHDNPTKQELIRLGKEYNLLTEFTSFVAIDSEISNKTGNSTLVKQPLSLPRGVSNAAIGTTVSYKSTGSNSKQKMQAPVAISNEFTVLDNEDVESIEEEVFVRVEQMPQFQGGTELDFIKYIQQQIIYPKEAVKTGIEGRVFVSFAINEKGEIEGIKIVRGVNPLLDNEVLRVLKLSPKWTPGKQQGKPVKISFTIPVEFKLPEK